MEIHRQIEIVFAIWFVWRKNQSRSLGVGVPEARDVAEAG